MQVISPRIARRVALMKQHLAGPRITPDKTGIMKVIRDIGYVQLDPTKIVAPSHLLVLWSRLGDTIERLLTSFFGRKAVCSRISPTAHPSYRPRTNQSSTNSNATS